MFSSATRRLKMIEQTSIFSAVVVTSLTFGGCQLQDSPVVFGVSVPQPNVIGFQANLTQRYGLGLAGSFALPKNVGEVVLAPETSSSGFGLGLNLNTAAFLRSTWLQFQEVNVLPTGALFPGWMSGPVVDITSPDLNRYGVDYHFFLGTRGVWYLGAAGLIHKVDESFPAVNIGYTFYDNKGNVVIGFQFFGPKIGSNGKAVVPGGIFIGTNLSPLLPPAPDGNVAVAASALRIQNGELLNIVEKANHGQPIRINGQSVASDIQTSGKDAGKYKSQGEIRGLIDRYMEASRHTY